MKSNCLYSDDGEILAGLKAGESSALDQLYDQHSGFLLGYLLKKGIMPDDAADLIQDLYLELWVKREQLLLRKNFRTYLTWKVRNRIIDQYHHCLVEQAYRQVAITETPHATDTEDQCNYRELQLALDSSIASLPFKMQEVFRYRKLQGASVKEIALQMDISEQTVKNQITTALQKLRVSLKDFLILTYFIIFLKLFFKSI